MVSLQPHQLVRHRAGCWSGKVSADAFKATKQTPIEIGRALGVEALITGSVMRANDRIQVSAQLVNVASGAVLWANRYERNAGDVLSLQNQLVGAIAREVRATITPEQTARFAAQARRVNPAAHDAYLRARSSFASMTNSADTKDSLDALTASESYLTLVSARPDEAGRTSQRILEIDPLNPFSRVQPVLGVIFFQTV